MRPIVVAMIAACSSPASSPSSYGIGVQTRMFVDPTRPTPANGLAPATSERQLVTELWYPAAGAAASEVRDAKLAAGAFPLVLFVHGSSSSRRQSTFLTQALAAAGYVVMAADFPLTAETTPGGPSDLHVEDQTGDLGFLADRAAALSADAGDSLHGAIDPEAGYVVIGHSTGGAVALLAAFGDHHDDRVRAAVAISADSCFFAESFFRTRAIPLLALTGSRDLLVPPPDNTRRAYELAGPPRSYASLRGGSHLYFTDYEVPDELVPLSPTTSTSDLAVTLARYGNGSACEPIPAASSDPQLGFADQHARTTAAIIAYLDHVVHGAPLALDAPGVDTERDP